MTSDGDNLDLASELTELILPEYKHISIKVNYLKDEFNENDVVPPDGLFSVDSYLQDLNIEILFSTCGLHTLGENKNPHIHYHIICRSVPKCWNTNISKHRIDWLKKPLNDGFSFEGVSFRFPTKKEPVWSHLAYPYKEGKIIGGAKHNFIEKKYQDFLLAYAKNLYAVSLGDRARQDAFKERRLNSLNDLFKICEEHKSKFNSLREMCLLLDTIYISTLSLEELPDPRNYKTNCQKIAVSLKIANYSDF